jgi:hypothetical protein
MGGILRFPPRPRVRRIARVPEYSDPRQVRDRLPEELQPFGNQIGRLGGQPRDIAAGPRQTGNYPASHGINRRREDDWDGLRRAFHGESGGCCDHDDDVNLESNQLNGKLWKALSLTLRISALRDEVPSCVLRDLARGVDGSPTQDGLKAIPRLP